MIRPTRELIVMAKPDRTGEQPAFLRDEIQASSSDPAFRWSELSFHPLFRTTPTEPLIEETAPPATLSSELARFFKVEAPHDQLDHIASRLRQITEVEAAYVRPVPETPRIMMPKIGNPNGAGVETPSSPPDFSDDQGYLQPAPYGIDAKYAWTIPGGKGADVQIIDIERGWNFSHGDLQVNEGGVIGNENAANNDHGTAVIGELGGDENSFGVTGICPEAKVFGISNQALGGPNAIRLAADYLRSGDIIILEMHLPGPRYNFEQRLDQKGYIAVEWFPDFFAAIQYAINKGIVVVEAAGNGEENLDDPLYEIPKEGFPNNWRNPFGNHRNYGTDAVLVGAGAPIEGLHGSQHGPVRSRLPFSNYGEAIDVQGWGEEVTTTGYGDLYRGSNQNEWYTRSFGGTSSASPIVAGAIACLQGILRAQGKKVLTSALTRGYLRLYGSPQQDAPSRPASQRIGNLPDLRKLVERVQSM